MYYSAHIIAGATAASLAGHNVDGFVAGLVSHLILDIIPHHDHKNIWPCIFDIIFGTVIFILLFLGWHSPPQFFWGALGGVIPDIEVAFYYQGLIKRRFFPSHTGFVPHCTVQDPVGVITQLCTVIFSLFILS